MLGALLVFNKYFNDIALDNGSSDALGIDPALSVTQQAETYRDAGRGHEQNAVKNAVKLGFRNAGSWLLSTSSLGLLAQLTFALPRIAAMHKSGVDDDEQSEGEDEQMPKDKHPATLLHTFLRWAMRSHWANAVMIVVCVCFLGGISVASMKAV